MGILMKRLCHTSRSDFTYHHSFELYSPRAVDSGATLHSLNPIIMARTFQSNSEAVVAMDRRYVTAFDSVASALDANEYLCPAQD
jgi:hypothetical protein